MKWPVPAILLFCAGCCRASAADNLLSNPTFDHDLSGWQVESGTQPVWDGFDIYGATTSGSALIADATPLKQTQFSLDELTQCIVLPTVGTYTVHASGYARSAQAAGYLILSFSLLTRSSQCTNAAVEAGSRFISPTDSWNTVEYTFGEVTELPAVIQIKLGALKTVDGGEFTGYFDNVTLSSDLIFLDGFDR